MTAIIVFFALAEDGDAPIYDGGAVYIATLAQFNIGTICLGVCNLFKQLVI